MDSTIIQTLSIVNIGILVANLGVLGLTIKLYTEFYKERVKGP